jgi:hypothetical protein
MPQACCAFQRDAMARRIENRKLQTAIHVAAAADR